MTIIVVGNNSYTTSLEPTHAAEDHGHDELPMEDSNLKDGQIKLKANPPPNGKYIWVQKGNEDQFTVETDGVVRCKALVSSGGLETLDDGSFAHKYENNTDGDGNYIRVGRTGNFGEPVTLGLFDGIHHRRNIDDQVHEYMQQLHPSQPKIDIIGATEPNVDWIRITNDELEALNQMKIKQLKNRYNDPAINRAFIIGVDRAKMRLYDVEQAAQKIVESNQETQEQVEGTAYDKFSGFKV